MSRYDRPTNEPDLDRYETRTDDSDVPDFDAPDPPVDPVEHAAHEALSAMKTLALQLVKVTDVDRAFDIKKLTKDIWKKAEKLDALAASVIDECMERRR